MKESSIDELHGSNINAINAHLIEQLSSFDDSLKIFVLGDDQRNLNLIKKKWGKRVVTISKKSELLDALIAKNAKHFLACGLSHTSCFIASNFNDKQQTLLPFNVLSRFENVPKMEDHQN
jgi:hypothetical protein